MNIYEIGILNYNSKTLYMESLFQFGVKTYHNLAAFGLLAEHCH